MRAPSSKRTSARAAVLSAACAAGLLSSGAYAQTWVPWGDLGKGGVSMSGTQPRQFGITVANGAVFGAWNSGDPTFQSSPPFSDDGAEIFKATAPSNITHNFLLAGDANARYAGIDKIFYNPFDGQLYARANSWQEWAFGGLNAEGTVYPGTSGDPNFPPKAGVIRINPNDITNAGQTRVFDPASVGNGLSKNVSGLTLDTDTGAVLFSVNGSRQGNGALSDRNIFFLKAGTTDVHQILQGDGNRNIGQVGDAIVYAGKDANGKARIIELDAGNTVTNLIAFSFDPTATLAPGATINAETGSQLGAVSGASTGNTGGNGGPTVSLFDRTNQTLHVMQRQGSGLKVINNSFYPAATDSTLMQIGATSVRRGDWHATITGATPNGNAGTSTAGVAVDAAALTPDGNILMGFSGATPYGVAGSETKLWMKVTQYNGTGVGRTASNDTNNWVDLGAIDGAGGQVVGLTTGNIGSGSLGEGKNSFDVWAVTQDRISGQLRLSATSNTIVRLLSWDRNGTTAGAGGPNPNGDWDGAATNFNTNIDGNNFGSLVAATSSNDVVSFSAGGDATGAYTVNVVGPQVANRVSFDSGTATLADGGSGASVSAGSYAASGGVTGNINVPIVNALTKNGTGQINVGGTQNYAGATTVNAGTLKFNSTASLYNGNTANWTDANIVVKNNAALAVNVGGAGEFTSGDVSTLAALGSGSGGFQSGSILALDTTNAAGPFTHNAAIANPNGGANVLAISKLGTGELVLGGSNTYGGGTIVNRGTLTATLSTGLGTGPLTVNSTAGDATVVNLSTNLGGTTTGSLSGTVSGGGTANINNGGQLFTVNQTTNGNYQGTISGTGGLTKTGNSTLTLSNGNSSYSGATTISAGTVVAGALADAGSNSSIGTGNGTPSAADLVLNGGVLGYNGGATANTNRQFTLTTAGGGLDVSGGGPVTFTNTAPVAMSGSGARTLNLSGGGAGLGTLAAQVSDGTGGGTSVTKSGSSTWRLSNDTNNFTGAVNVTGGILEATSIGNNGAASAVGAGSSVVLNNAGIRYLGAGQSTNRTLSVGPGVVSTDNGGLGDANNSGLGNGATSTIDASGGGALTLTGGLTGTTTGGFRRLLLTGSNTGNNSVGFNLTDGGPNSGSVMAVTKTGAGTWVLGGGNNTYTGRTTVSAGKLILQGTKPVGDYTKIGYNSASGSSFSNQLFIDGTGSVELPANDVHLERLAMTGGTSLKLGGAGTKLNVYTGASGNGGAQDWDGIISGQGSIYLSPPNAIADPAIGLPGNVPVTFPSSGVLRTIRIRGFNTFTGDFRVQGANVNFTPPATANLAETVSLGGGDLEVSNLRATQAASNVDFGMNTNNASGGTVDLVVGNLVGSIVPPSNAGAGGVNTVSFGLTGGGQRRLVIKQTANTTFAGAFNGNGGQIWLDPSSTGTLTLTGNNTNNGRIRVLGGTLQLVSAATLSANQMAGTGGGVEIGAAGTLMLNVGGNAPVTPQGVPTIGAEWTSAQIDTLRSLPSFTSGTPPVTTERWDPKPGSQLGFDTTNAVGGAFTYNNSTPMTGVHGVTKAGPGTLTLPNANALTGATKVNAGTLIAGNADALPSGAMTIATGANVQLQSGLPKAATVASITTSTGGKIDITNNSMVIKSQTDAQVRAQLATGYNGGAWNGATGILSTTAAASTEASVGYASNASLGLTEFKGVTGLDSDDVIVKYTYAGDANLDGKVDIGDLGLLAGAWQQLSGKVWFDGDFTYDGAVNIGDLGLLAGNWQKGTVGNPNPPLMDFNTALAQFSAFDGVAVPEPTSLALLGLGGLAALGRRRRRGQQN